MSYHPQSLSGTFTDVASAATAVATDPCLAQVANLVLQLRDAQSGAVSVAGLGALGATSSSRGIGLCYAVKPLQIAVTIRRKPWLAGLAAAGVVGGLIYLGYLLHPSCRKAPQP